MSNYEQEMYAKTQSWDNSNPDTAETYPAQPNTQYDRTYSVADGLGNNNEGGNNDQYPNNDGATYGTSYYYDAQGNSVFEAPPGEYNNNYNNQDINNTYEGGDNTMYNQQGAYQQDYPQGGEWNSGTDQPYTDDGTGVTPTTAIPVKDGTGGYKGYARTLYNTIGCSVPWKLYITFHFYTAFVLVALLGYNAMYACIYRMYSLPFYDKIAFWQTMAFFCILLVLHFFITSILTLIYEYARDYWNLTPASDYLWGMNAKYFSLWFVQLLLIIIYGPVPFLWSIIYTSMQTRNVLYFFEFYFFLTMMITLVIVALGWVWMYWRALVQKKRAYKHRKKYKFQPGDEALGMEAQNVKIRWYENPLVLKEYGMDIPSLSVMMAFTFSGLVLHIIMSIVLSIDGLAEEKQSPAWIGVGLGYFILIFLLREMANSKRWYRVGMVCVGCIGIYGVLALAGCGVSGGNLIGVWIVLFVATQGMCLRKRDYFSREESEGQVLEPDADKARIDPYLCCGQSCWRACFVSYYDSWFGRTMTPEEHVKTNQLRIERRSLWSDAKMMNNYLLFFGFCLIMLLIFGRLVRNVETRSLAVRGMGAIVPSSGDHLPHVMCSWSSNIPAAPFDLMDIAFLTTLTYSEGDTLDKDFKLWFSHNANITRNYPRKVSNDADIGGSVNAKWIDYYDATSKTHVIVVRSFATTTSWMRDVDIWGEPIVYQLASIAIPFVSSWPDHLKVDFVYTMAFLKDWFGGGNVTDYVEAYVQKQKESGHNVILAGHGTNGGLAKIVAARTDSRVVAFNAPGTLYLRRKLSLKDNSYNEVTISTDRDFYSLIDAPAGATHVVPCENGLSETSCSRMLYMTTRLVELCGDRYGREAKPKDSG